MAQDRVSHRLSRRRAGRAHGGRSGRPGTSGSEGPVLDRGGSARRSRSRRSRQYTQNGRPRTPHWAVAVFGRIQYYHRFQPRASTTVGTGPGVGKGDRRCPGREHVGDQRVGEE